MIYRLRMLLVRLLAWNDPVLLNVRINGAVVVRRKTFYSNAFFEPQDGGGVGFRNAEI